MFQIRNKNDIFDVISDLECMVSLFLTGTGTFGGYRDCDEHSRHVDQRAGFALEVSFEAIIADNYMRTRHIEAAPNWFHGMTAAVEEAGL